MDLYYLQQYQVIYISWILVQRIKISVSTSKNDYPDLKTHRNPVFPDPDPKRGPQKGKVNLKCPQAMKTTLSI